MKHKYNGLACDVMAYQNTICTWCPSHNIVKDLVISAFSSSILESTKIHSTVSNSFVFHFHGVI